MACLVLGGPNPSPSHLYGLDRAQLEAEVLGRSLRDRGFSNVADAVAADPQEGDFDRSAFEAALDDSLATGLFRLVIVLDDAPPELTALVGYLEAVTNLTIDLVAVSQYEVGGSHLLVPQRVEPERVLTTERTAEGRTSPGSARKAAGFVTEGADDFDAVINGMPVDMQGPLRRLSEWAKQLESEGLVRLSTLHGKSEEMWSLLPQLKAEGVGLVTIYNAQSNASLQLWLSVFRRRAPESLVRINALLSPREVTQGMVVTEIGDDLLAALTDAYREAAAGRITQ